MSVLAWVNVKSTTGSPSFVNMGSNIFFSKMSNNDYWKAPKKTRLGLDNAQLSWSVLSDGTSVCTTGSKMWQTCSQEYIQSSQCYSCDGFGSPVTSPISLALKGYSVSTRNKLVKIIIFIQFIFCFQGWTHVAATHSSGSVVLYVNGSQSQTGVTGETVIIMQNYNNSIDGTFQLNKICIGCVDADFLPVYGKGYVDASFDDLMVFGSVALTSTQVIAVMKYQTPTYTAPYTTPSILTAAGKFHV